MQVIKRFFAPSTAPSSLNTPGWAIKSVGVTVTECLRSPWDTPLMAAEGWIATPCV